MLEALGRVWPAGQTVRNDDAVVLATVVLITTAATPLDGKLGGVPVAAPMQGAPVTCTLRVAPALIGVLGMRVSRMRQGDDRLTNVPKLGVAGAAGAGGGVAASGTLAPSIPVP